jgi:hypothetical protein
VKKSRWQCLPGYSVYETNPAQNNLRVQFTHFKIGRFSPISQEYFEGQRDKTENTLKIIFNS